MWRVVGLLKDILMNQCYKGPRIQGSQIHVPPNQSIHAPVESSQCVPVGHTRLWGLPSSNFSYSVGMVAPYLKYFIQ